MSAKKIQILPLNRVEGDLELHLELRDGAVYEVRSVGTMYRGIENILKGRAPLDSLVITPRICGICSTAHLKAAAKALDMVFGVDVPDNARRVRNVTLMAEQLQNDLRHSFLLFCPDFTHAAHARQPLHAEAVQRYLPLKGTTARQVIQQTKTLLEIVAVLGGQWPHSSFMVPGGVVSVAGVNEINQCRSLLRNFRRWYEHRILGCPLERWLDVKNRTNLFRWLEEKPAHHDSDLGFFIRFCAAAGLIRPTGGYRNFLSYGAFEMPRQTAVKRINGGKTLLPGGFVNDGVPATFNQEKIGEDIACARFTGYTGSRHPFNGLTRPLAATEDDVKYSWAKAPRYHNLPAETGPLAERVVAADPLFIDLVTPDGPSVFSRQLARLVRPAQILPVMDTWLQEIGHSPEGFFTNYAKVTDGQGFGLVQAHRGALGHWLQIENGRIAHYQIITPTAWNASPRDGAGRRGPWEQALVGTHIDNPAQPIEAEHIVRSFDPCLVCAVHTVAT